MGPQENPVYPLGLWVLRGSGLGLSLPLECGWHSAALTLPGAQPTFLGI